jgi:hypothetical protein
MAAPKAGGMNANRAPLRKMVEEDDDFADTDISSMLA